MHTNDLVHLDIKPDNILLDEEWIVLCDFTMTRKLTTPDEKFDNIDGTKHF